MSRPTTFAFSFGLPWATLPLLLSSSPCPRRLVSLLVLSYIDESARVPRSAGGACGVRLYRGRNHVGGSRRLLVEPLRELVSRILELTPAKSNRRSVFEVLRHPCDKPYTGGGGGTMCARGPRIRFRVHIDPHANVVEIDAEKSRHMSCLGLNLTAEFHFSRTSCF